MKTFLPKKIKELKDFTVRMGANEVKDKKNILRRKIRESCL